MSTKKNVIRVFSLILYLLVACTILSNWIEEQMMTEVKISERQNRGDSFGFSQSALFADDEGNHLYEMIDGTGWSIGLRARELPSASWYIDAYGKVQFDGSEQAYRFVVSASRQPQEGDKVAVVESFEKAEDQYLCIYSDGIPEEIVLPRNTEIAAQSENVLLLNLKDAEFPFFEQTAKGMTDTLSVADRIIGLTEAKLFLEQLPLIASVCMALIGGVVFWGAACLFSIRADGNKVYVWLNAAFVAVLLIALMLVLRSVELPASMMPCDNIFNLEYYSKELLTICNALQGLSLMDLPSFMENIVCQCSAILYYGAIILISIIAIEGILQISRLWKLRSGK